MPRPRSKSNSNSNVYRVNMRHPERIKQLSTGSSSHRSKQLSSGSSKTEFDSFWGTGESEVSAGKTYTATVVQRERSKKNASSTRASASSSRQDVINEMNGENDPCLPTDSEQIIMVPPPPQVDGATVLSETGSDSKKISKKDEQPSHPVAANKKNRSGGRWAWLFGSKQRASNQGNP